MSSLDQPIVTPAAVIMKRGIQPSDYAAEKAILCFRGKRASAQVIETFQAHRVEGNILYHPHLYYSSAYDLFLLPQLVWGGPVTAIIIEELAALGVRTMVGFGAAGSINPAIQPGRCFVAREALCIDGTSQEYAEMTTCRPDEQFFQYFANRSPDWGAALLTGVTTDSLYRETPRKVDQWRRLGADCLNLEVSPFYVVSQVLGIRSIYVGLITDYVGETWDHTFWNQANTVDATIIDHIQEFFESL